MPIRRSGILRLAFGVLIGGLGACSGAPPPASTTDAAAITALVDRFLTSGDDATDAAVRAELQAIFARDGVLEVSEVGDEAAYGFVLVNMLGQPQEFRDRFAAAVEQAAARTGLPEDAVILTRALQRQAEVEARYKTATPSQPALRDEIARLLAADQAVREKAGFDLQKMAEADARTAGPLMRILETYGVPTYDLVGVQAAKDFAVLVQHQSPALRAAVLPKLKANVDAGQADPAVYATVYDRTQRDQGRNQLYGQNLECQPGKALEVSPVDEPATVNVRRAELGLMRLDTYARMVRLVSPDMCGAAP